MQKGAGDWSADALADNGTETGDATDLDGMAACEVGVAFAEDNTGAIDGVATIYVLGTADGTNYEAVAQASLALSVTPVQNSTVYKRFMVDPSHLGTFKVAIYNTAGQELAVTVKYRTATWPVAS
jgi:hypothetical protein